MCVMEVDEQGARRLALDVGTVHAGEPKLLGEGGFPIALLECGFSIDVAEGEASVEQDRRRILNSLAGCPTSMLDTAVPPMSHPNYDKVSRWHASMCIPTDASVQCVHAGECYPQW